MMCHCSSQSTTDDPTTTTHTHHLTSATVRITIKRAPYMYGIPQSTGLDLYFAEFNLTGPASGFVLGVLHADRERFVFVFCEAKMSE